MEVIEESQPATRVPVVYVTDLEFDRFDAADLFDLAFLVRSPDHELTAVCLTNPDGDGRRVLDALTLAANADVPPVCDGDGLIALLQAAPTPVDLVVVAGFRVIADRHDAHPELFREKVSRLFLVGGHVNDYRLGAGERRLPIDPRLRERLSYRFALDGDRRNRTVDGRRAWASLLTSGQGVIWLPYDICLWQYAAPGLLGGGNGGAVADFLVRETFWNHLQTSADRYRAAEQPVVLSSLPALLLAAHPDPALWLRWFRVVTAHVTTHEAEGVLEELDLGSDRPNLYVVTAIDGQALGKLLTARLRGG